MKKIISVNTLVWFGAAVSIAEIMTGTLLAPLGWGKAMAAIILGHLVGGLLLYLAGLIGAQNNLTAMESVKRSFGARGGQLFAALNLIQLIGWTAVMIAAGAQSAQGLLQLPLWAWSAIIGALILLWVSIRAREFKVLNFAATALLFLLSLLLSLAVFHGRKTAVPLTGGPLRFGEALELSIAMPLSWLPLIADYTRGSRHPKQTSFVSAAVYTAVSCWMYAIGLGAALFAGEASITVIMSRAGLGVPALLIVLFSTVTTTYLDVYSSEMSLESITKKIQPFTTGILVSLIGTLLAIFAPTSAFENFLYWIGSIFAPMIAIQIADVFLCRHRERTAWNLPALLCWLAGFVLYRILLAVNPFFGSTLPVMLCTMLGYLATGTITDWRISEQKSAKKP